MSGCNNRPQSRANPHSKLLRFSPHSGVTEWTLRTPQQRETPENIGLETAWAAVPSKSQVKRLTLNNSVQMLVLGFGAYQIADAAECERSVLDALDAGYRRVDTASYMNEEAVEGPPVVQIPEVVLQVLAVLQPRHTVDLRRRVLLAARLTQTAGKPRGEETSDATCRRTPPHSSFRRWSARRAVRTRCTGRDGPLPRRKDHRSGNPTSARACAPRRQPRNAPRAVNLPRFDTRNPSPMVTPFDAVSPRPRLSQHQAEIALRVIVPDQVTLPHPTNTRGVDVDKDLIRNPGNTIQVLHPSNRSRYNPSLQRRTKLSMKLG